MLWADIIVHRSPPFAAATIVHLFTLFNYFCYANFIALVQHFYSLGEKSKAMNDEDSSKVQSQTQAEQWPTVEHRHPFSYSSLTFSLMKSSFQSGGVRVEFPLYYIVMPDTF